MQSLGKNSWWIPTPALPMTNGIQTILWRNAYVDEIANFFAVCAGKTDSPGGALQRTRGYPLIERIEKAGRKKRMKVLFVGLAVLAPAI